jgi:hypothetical protein
LQRGVGTPANGEDQSLQNKRIGGGDGNHAAQRLGDSNQLALHEAARSKAIAGINHASKSFDTGRRASIADFMSMMQNRHRSESEISCDLFHDGYNSGIMALSSTMASPPQGQSGSPGCSHCRASSTRRAQFSRLSASS